MGYQRNDGGLFMLLARTFQTGTLSQRLLLAWVSFAFLLGIIQDCWLGVTFLIQIVGQKAVEGSFPFMLGWTVYMLWGFTRPLERRSVLLITAILVFLMAVEKIMVIVLSGGGDIPVVNALGILLWTTSWLAARRLVSRRA